MSNAVTEFTTQFSWIAWRSNLRIKMFTFNAFCFYGNINKRLQVYRRVNLTVLERRRKL